jgi:hypothetical protein
MAKRGVHRTIYVYADWVGLGRTTLMALLHTTLLRGQEIFSFEYDEAWLKSRSAQALTLVGHLEVAPYFRVSDEKSIEIISIVQSEVSKWDSIAEKVGISKSERKTMAKAFNIS